jgi:hypothetical protein
MSPYIPHCIDDEISCFTTLLLYVPWPKGGESRLCCTGIENERVSARDMLQKYLYKNEGNKNIPTALYKQLQAYQTSEKFLEAQDEHYEQKYPDMEDLDESDNATNDSADEVDEDTRHLMDDDEWAAHTSHSKEIRTDTDDKEETELPAHNVPPQKTDLHTSMTGNDLKSYQDYIGYKLIEFRDSYAREYTTGESESSIYRPNSFSDEHPFHIIYLDDHEVRTQKLKIRTDRFTENQQDAYAAATSKLSDSIWCLSGVTRTVNRTLVQFVSGGGGVGKSEYVKCVIEYTRLMYGKQRGTYGSVLAVGPTGASAHNIGGYTWQSAVSKCGYEKKTNMLSASTLLAMYTRLQSVRLLVIDEVSMISLESLKDLSRRISQALASGTTNISEREQILKREFGGLHVIYCGDLWQLKCIGGTSLYDPLIGANHHSYSVDTYDGQKTWRCTNDYREFVKSTRFRTVVPFSVPPLEQFLVGGRVGKPDENQIIRMNTRSYISREHAYINAHKHALWLASTKKAVAEINNDMHSKLTCPISCTPAAFTFDVVAEHIMKHRSIVSIPSNEEYEKLFKMTDSKLYAPALLKLAIGSRVKITDNLATQIGNTS